MASTKELQKTGDFGESIGVSQIRLLPGRPSREWLKVPYNNIIYAYKLSNGGNNFSPWTCHTKQGVVNPSQIKGL